MNVKNDLHTVWATQVLQIVLNVHKPVKVKQINSQSLKSNSKLFKYFPGNVVLWIQQIW